MNDEERIRNHKIASYFCENQIRAHVVLNNDIFYNGFIDEVSADFFFIKDLEDGTKLVFFRELKRPIEEFKEVEDV